MVTIAIDGLIFTFPPDWQASKFDEWSFYRNQFSKQFNGIKAVDAIAIAPDRSAFLVEVKDYRHPGTEKPSQLPQAIANKMLHTLAALLPAKLHAAEPLEKALAAAMLNCASLQIVAHIELPPRHIPVVDLADLKQKLKQLLRAVDAHPKIVSTQNMCKLLWMVA